VLQARMGVAVPNDPAAVRPGDLLFYFSPSDGDLGHVEDLFVTGTVERIG
jgi:hypothetical protein